MPCADDGLPYDGLPYWKGFCVYQIEYQPAGWPECAEALPAAVIWILAEEGRPPLKCSHIIEARGLSCELHVN